MNRADVELLNQSLANMGQSFANTRQQSAEAAYRQAQLDLLKQKVGLDETYRNAQLAAQTNVQNRMAGTQERIAQNEADKNANDAKRIDIEKSGQDLASAHDSFLGAAQDFQDQAETLAQSVVDGKTDSQDAFDQFAASIDAIGKINPVLKTQMLSRPNMLAIYNGTQPWQATYDQIQQRKAQEAAQQSAQAPKMSTLSDPNNPNGPTATGVTDAHGAWHPVTPPANENNPQRDKLIAGQIQASLPQNNSPTNAAYAAQLFDKLSRSGQQPPAPAVTAPNGVQLTARDLAGMNANRQATQGAGPSAQTVQPDPRDAIWLSGSPTPGRIAKFEAKYGQGSAAALLTQQQPTSAGMVQVQHPNGQTGMIPAANLGTALQLGFKLVTPAQPIAGGGGLPISTPSSGTGDDDDGN
jgi:hypothetical protein